MRTPGPLRFWIVATIALPSAGPAAADATYLQRPGLTGPSSSSRYSGWFEVNQDNVVLLPGVYDSGSFNCLLAPRERECQTRRGS